MVFSLASGRFAGKNIIIGFKIPLASVMHNNHRRPFSSTLT
jgi:hypothetical protein